MPLCLDCPVNIINWNSGLALDVRWDNKNVHQWELHNLENQRWTISAAPDGDNSFIITSDISTTEMVLHVERSEDGNGSKVSARPKTGLRSHGWKITEIYANVYIICLEESCYAMDVAGSSMTSGAPVVIWDRHERDNQLWRIVPTITSQFPFFNSIEFDAVSVPMSSYEDCRGVLDKFGFVVVLDVLEATEILEASANIREDLLEVCDTDACSIDSTVKEAFEIFSTADTREAAKYWPGRRIEGSSRGLPQVSFDDINSVDTLFKLLLFFRFLLFSFRRGNSPGK